MPSHSHSKSASHHHAHHHPQRHPLALTITAEAGGGSSSSSNNNNNVERIEWSRSTILGFIEDYRRQRVLWDPNTKGYHIKQIKYESLKQLGLKYGTEIRSIRSKIKSLRSSFHREHGKVINGQRRGIHYQPMWFAYEAIRFILDGEQPPQQTQQLQQQQQQQQQQHNHQRSLLHDVGESSAAKRAANAVVDGVVDGVAGGDDDDDDDDDDDEGDEVDEAGDGDAGDGVGERVVVTAELAQDDDDDKTQVGRQQALKQRHSASGNNNNNAAGAAAASASSDDEHGVKHATDSDAEMQHFGNIISAEDVKTELIESDMPDMQKSPLAYLALTPTVSTSCAKKRKRTPQPDDLSSAAASHQLHKHESPTSSKFAHNMSRAQEPCSSTTTATATTSSHNYNNHNNHGNGNNNQGNTNTSFSTAGQTDEYGVFGEYVAITIRKLKTSKAKIVVKHLINNLLYEAELGKYDYGIPASKEPPQLYKT